MVHAEIDPGDEILLVKRFTVGKRIGALLYPVRQILPTHPSKNL